MMLLLPWWKQCLLMGAAIAGGVVLFQLAEIAEDRSYLFSWRFVVEGFLVGFFGRLIYVKGVEEGKRSEKPIRDLDEYK